MAEHYYTVGVHGTPTKETAPHGYMWRAPMNDNVMGPWMAAGAGAHVADQRAEWYPLPAPPTEEAPPPEPEARWRVAMSGYVESIWTKDGRPSSAEVRHAADALNALDRDGVAWGPGRPMSELPDVGLVLVQMSSGVPCTFYIRKADYIATHRNTYDCWWPLPGEAQ